MALLGLVSRIEKAGLELSVRVAEKVAAAEVDHKEGLALFREIAKMTSRAVESARIAQAMERSLLGEPDRNIGVQLSVMPAEASHHLEMANKAYARMRRRGLVVDVLPEEIDMDLKDLANEVGEMNGGSGGPGGGNGKVPRRRQFADGVVGELDPDSFSE
jgi:hypothetical protein